MRIIISPAKKMNNASDMPYQSLPFFIDEAKQIFDILKSKKYFELKKIWKCNDKIATENSERLKYTNVHKNLVPALLAYEGIQYQYMKPGIFTDDEWTYVNQHLRILSGVYGLLKPFDGIVPYRLEMQAKIQINQAKNLYEFWGSRLHDHIYKETNLVIDLASNEYSRCIRDGLKENETYVECVFAVRDDAGKLKVKATWAKMARGEMVRYMATKHCQTIDDIKGFKGMGYIYNDEESDDTRLVFIKGKTNDANQSTI